MFALPSGSKCPLGPVETTLAGAVRLLNVELG